MPNFAIQPRRRVWAALLLGTAGLLLGWLLLTTVPQRPDGDGTALAQFDAQYPAAAWQHNLRDALWLNLSGALFAWSALARLFSNDSRPSSVVHRLSSIVRRLFWLALLLAWSGWAWNQSRGWQGQLFLEPGVATPLGEDARPTVAFSRFLVPPAPDGPGRALALRLLAEGRAYDIATTTPYRNGGWTIAPLWYGATVRAPELAVPLFFGGDGTQTATLAVGGTATVTLDVETLQASSDPPLNGLRANHHAILRARFAPGDGLICLGLGLAMAAPVLALVQRRYNRRM